MSKGPATDLDQYDFKPREILQMIVEMYVAVAREDKARVMTMITEDAGAAPPTESKTLQPVIRAADDACSKASALTAELYCSCTAASETLVLVRDSQVRAHRTSCASTPQRKPKVKETLNRLTELTSSYSPCLICAREWQYSRMPY